MANLVRAFTVARRKNSSKTTPVTDTAVPQRSLTTKTSQKYKRPEISAPLELISTTNMLSYNAPDLYPKSATVASSMSSRSSVEDSARLPSSGMSTPLTSADASSIDTAPSPTSPEPNHLSCYFGGPAPTSVEPPSIPARAPSHTKKSHESISRVRSLSRMSALPSTRFSLVRSPSMASIPKISTTEFTECLHPFGSELTQVSELAEDYTIAERYNEKQSASQKLDENDEEERELISKGFCKFRAEDYMNEIQGYLLCAFGNGKPTIWI